MDNEILNAAEAGTELWKDDQVIFKDEILTGYNDFKGKLDLRGLTISEIAGVRPAMIVPLNAPEITVNSQKDSPEQNSHSSHERPVPDPAGSQTYRNGQRSNPENMSARGNPESPVRRPNSGTGNSDPENVALDAIRPPGDAEL